MGDKSTIGKVTEGFRASTRAVTDINRENTAGVMAGTKANFGAATAPDAGLLKVKQANGLGEKIKVMADNIKEGARENSELEKENRERIQSHEAYKNLLEEQRENRQAVISGEKYGRRAKQG